MIVLGACADGTSSSSAAAFAERDSAGIVIAATPGWQARAALDWVVSTFPDVEIGVTSESSGEEPAPPRYEFSQIGGVRQLSDGRVVVLDGGTQEVRFFDSSGQFLNTVGGRGQGPVEFEGAALVPAFASDSLLFFDMRLRRFHFLSTDADGHRMVRPMTWEGARAPVGFVDPNVLVEDGMLYKPTTTGVIELPMTYAWTNIVTGKRILVVSFTVRREYFVLGEGRQPGFFYQIPFSATPAAAVTRRGALITADVSSEIKEYDLSGRLRRIIRIDEPPRSVTAADIRRYVELTDGPVYSDMPIPETIPAFGESLLVDDEGWLWAQVYEWDPTQRPAWLVFESNGRAHGSISTPVGLDIHQIGRDFILGVWKDELDVEHVRKYRLDRHPANRAGL